MRKQSAMKLSGEKDDAEDAPSGCGNCMKRHPFLVGLFEEFTQQSSTHGVKYIGSKKLQLFERLFWGVVMLISLGFSVYLAINVFAKYNDSPMIINFQTQAISIAQIPFPAITICNVNMLKTSVLNELYDHVNELIKQISESKVSNKTLEGKLAEHIVHMDHLSQYCLSAKSFRRHINATQVDVNGKPDFVQLTEDIIKDFNETITARLLEVENSTEWLAAQRRLLAQATIRCEDLMLKCMWAGTMRPCKDIFFHVNTRHGRCCVFNMMPKFILQNISEEDGRAIREMKDLPDEAKKEWKKYGNEESLLQQDKEKVANRNYPQHQKAGGKQYGLTVLVNPESSEYSTCTPSDGWGFKIVAHSPVSAPSIMDYGAVVASNNEVFVEIEPHVTVADEDMLSGIDLDKRGCLMVNESKLLLKHYNFYSKENCVSECLAHYTFKACLCVRYFMPRNDTQKLCRAKQHKCADDVRHNITKTFGKDSPCGHCQAPCTDTLYKLQMSFFDLRKEEAAVITYTDRKGKVTNATDYSIIHFYMGADALYAKERKPLYDEFDLIANAGGFLSLTLGVSILSFIEIGYFCTLRAWFKFRSLFKRKSGKNDDTGEQSHNMLSTRTSSITIMGKKYNGYKK